MARSISDSRHDEIRLVEEPRLEGEVDLLSFLLSEEEGSKSCGAISAGLSTHGISAFVKRRKAIVPRRIGMRGERVLAGLVLEAYGSRDDGVAVRILYRALQQG
jgi:hypothetical protein